MLNRLYLKNKAEIDGKILERLQEEAQAKKREEEEGEQEEEEQVKVLSLINAYGGKGRCGPCSRPAKRGSSRADVVKRTSGSSEVWGGYLGPQGAK